METIKELVNVFFLDCRANDLNPQTLRWYSGRLGPLVRAIGNLPLDKVTRNILRGYFASLSERKTRYVNAPQRPPISGGLSRHTLHGHRRAVSTFFRWAYDEAELDPLRNPMRNIVRRGKKINHEDDIEAKAIDPVDFDRMIAVCGNGLRGIRDKLAITLLRNTGCRAGGLLTMDIADVDLDGRRIQIIEKFGKIRMVFLSPQTRELLRLWLKVRPGDGTTVLVGLRNGREGAPLTLSGLHSLIGDLQRAAGIKRRHNPHSFRHRFAIDYLNNGGDVESLSQILGHSDTYVTMRYYGRYCNNELQRRFDQFAPLSQKSQSRNSMGHHSAVSTQE